MRLQTAQNKEDYLYKTFLLGMCLCYCKYYQSRISELLQHMSNTKESLCWVPWQVAQQQNNT